MLSVAPIHWAGGCSSSVTFLSTTSTLRTIHLFRKMYIMMAMIGCPYYYAPSFWGFSCSLLRPLMGYLPLLSNFLFQVIQRYMQEQHDFFNENLQASLRRKLDSLNIYLGRRCPIPRELNMRTFGALRYHLYNIDLDMEAIEEKNREERLRSFSARWTARRSGQKGKIQWWHLFPL